MTLSIFPRSAVHGVAFAAVMLSACSSGSIATSMPASPQVPADPTPVPQTLAAHQGLEVLERFDGFNGAGTLGDARMSADPSGTYTSGSANFTISYGSPTGTYRQITYPFDPNGDIRRFNFCSSSNCTQTGPDDYAVETTLTGGAVPTLQYSLFGVWQEKLARGPSVAAGVFATGASPTSTRPTAGTATFGGRAAGFIAYSYGLQFALSGYVRLTADFAANSISGSVTDVTATDMIFANGFSVGYGASSVVNDILLSGGTLVGNSYAGIATAYDRPTNTPPYNVSINGAVGTFGGRFYGPGAAETAGSLALSDGFTDVIASFGASSATPGIAPVLPTIQTFTAHAGLEILASGFNKTPSAAPSAKITSDKTGFVLAYEQGRKVSFNTPYDPNVTTYTGCSKCFGSGFGMDRVTLVFTSGAPSDLDYSTYGTWQTGIFPFIIGDKGVFATGLQAAANDRPTAGTASYSGSVAGFAQFADGKQHTLDGRIVLQADFGSNTLGGMVNNVATAEVVSNGGYVTRGTAGIGNDIALSGAITDTRFSGIAATVDVIPGSSNVTVNTSGTRGTFGGAFYGPNVAEVAGSLEMSGTGTSVIASFGAKK